MLGLPWGVCCGLMKRSCEGVAGLSISLERVCSGGGGMGSWKLSRSVAIVHAQRRSASPSMSCEEGGTTGSFSHQSRRVRARRETSNSAGASSSVGVQLTVGQNRPLPPIEMFGRGCGFGAFGGVCLFSLGAAAATHDIPPRQKCNVTYQTTINQFLESVIIFIQIVHRSHS